MKPLPVIGNNPIRSHLLADLARPTSPLAAETAADEYGGGASAAAGTRWTSSSSPATPTSIIPVSPWRSWAGCWRRLGFAWGLSASPTGNRVTPWRRFGRPRLFFAISAGNMDSMINHYTANRKVRNDDAYSPGGRIGMRPDRATLAYCQRAREAYKGVPVIAGGVEASLRRLAHYDYWSDKVRRSILLDSKADLVVFGMGEDSIVEIARRLAGGRDGQAAARYARRRLRHGRLRNAARPMRSCCPATRR